MTTNDLMQLLDFNADDLARNREGKLSEMQHYRLRLRRRRTELIGVLAIIIGVLIATIFIFVGDQNNSPIMTLIGIGITICTTMMLGLLLRYWLRLNADITNNRVLINSGKLQRIAKPVNRRVITYAIRVNDVEVILPQETVIAFEHDSDYTLYRTPYTGTLLSAEKS